MADFSNMISTGLSSALEKLMLSPKYSEHLMLQKQAYFFWRQRTQVSFYFSKGWWLTPTTQIKSQEFSSVVECVQHVCVKFLSSIPANPIPPIKVEKGICICANIDPKKNIMIWFSLILMTCLGMRAILLEQFPITFFKKTKQLSHFLVIP